MVFHLGIKAHLMPVVVLARAIMKQAVKSHTKNVRFGPGLAHSEKRRIGEYSRAHDLQNATLIGSANFVSKNRFDREFIYRTPDERWLLVVEEFKKPRTVKEIPQTEAIEILLDMGTQACDWLYANGLWDGH